MNLEKRRLGRIGFEASIITLGGCGLGKLSQEVADEAVKLALKYGVNVVDVAPTYGEAELRLAPWIRKLRGNFFVAEKTGKRTKEEAWRELKGSLNRLGIKSFDLYQLHGVGDFDELETALQRGGAIDAFKEAKETGLINHIGITGHKDMRVLEKAVEMFEFDSVLLPVNMASMVKPEPANDFRSLLKKAIDKDMAVIAIKAIAERRWRTSEKNYTTWYKPLDNKEEVQRAVWFTLSQEPVVTYSLPCDIHLWPVVLQAAAKFTKLEKNQQNKALEHVKESGFKPLFPTAVEEFSPE